VWYHKEVLGLDLVVIDYLQIIDSSDRMQSDNSRVAYISRKLKMLAQQVGVPILLGCQLNRRTEDRQDQKPTLADMRDSGAIEQDASVVLAMHYHKPKIEDEFEKAIGVDRSITDGIIVLKNRRGMSHFEIGVNFSQPTVTFYDTKK
jgi:replicative DNA helicase